MRVIIADDEQKVCQLIYDLVPWENYGMTVVGMAYNGLDTLDLIKKQAPDLVITDIKMPGCDGLELIHRAKKQQEKIDFIIISGYRFFEYAQNAIKYGVSDYLLKPIKQEELMNTLKKMQEKYNARQERLTEENALRSQVKESRKRARENFLLGYLRDGWKMDVRGDIRFINNRYCMEFMEGSFTAFIIKIDYDYREQYGKGIELISAKAAYLIRQSLEACCYDMECCTKGNGLWCIVNYDPEQEKNIKKKIRQAFSEITVQRTVFPQFCFTCGIGEMIREAGEIGTAFLTADEAAQERLVRGAGKVIEYGNTYVDQPENSRLTDRTLKNLRNHVMALDADAMAGELKILERELAGHISGHGLWMLIRQISSSFVLYMKENKFHGQVLELFYDDFIEKSGCCGSMRSLFVCLSQCMRNCMVRIAEDKKQEGIKPIRMAKTYILKNYMTAITLEEMGRITGFNASYFSLLFKKETGKNFGEYISEVRMEKAKEMLKETDESISAICGNVGYSDLKHFTKSFKQETGLKPSEYRKLYS